MKIRLLALTVSLFLLFITPDGQRLNPPDAPELGMKAIRAEALRGHMRFLSDALLAGRSPESAGYQIAARYVATELDSMGVEPAGSNGTWFQQVPMQRAVVDRSRSSVTLIHAAEEKKLVDSEDYVLSADGLRLDSTIKAPVVFVGYGVTAPQQKYDDYADVDVRGKVVLAIVGAPPRFSATIRAYYSDGILKRRNAVTHGAVGIILMFLPEYWKRYSWSSLVPQVQVGETAWLDERGQPHNSFPALAGRVIVSESASATLFSGAPKTVEQALAAANASEPQSFPLNWRIRIHTVSVHQEFSSPNIVGRVKGGDDKLRDEYVVYTAHLDHIGSCPAVNGDAICHGAMDNASGTAAVLEIARAFTLIPRTARRSVLFLLVTGEEMGLLGSDYFAHFPTVPPESIVADLNIDIVPGMLFPMKDVVPLGSEHSSLDRDVRNAALRVGYQIAADPMPEEVSFITSDQFSFVQQGIPSLMIEDGPDSTDARLKGLELIQKWIATRYHTPLDNMDQPLNFESAAKAIRLNFLVGYEIAQHDQRPSWKPGDFFATLSASKGR